MSLKDEIVWAFDHALHHRRSAFRHDESVSAVIPVKALRKWLEHERDTAYCEADMDALIESLAELEGL